MSQRRIVNLPKTRQRELAAQFPWLMDVYLDQHRPDVHMVSVSVFDHWLSREEACAKLENVSIDEQARRGAVLADFCARLSAATEGMSVAQRGRQFRRMNFRRFLSGADASEFCRPDGGRVLGHRHFHVVLPEFHCAFTEAGIALIIFSTLDQIFLKRRRFGQAPVACTFSAMQSTLKISKRLPRATLPNRSNSHTLALANTELTN